MVKTNETICEISKEDEEKRLNDVEKIVQNWEKKPAKERRATMEQTGTFNPKKFYEILAGILSRKYGVKITVQEIKKAA